MAQKVFGITIGKKDPKPAKGAPVESQEVFKLAPSSWVKTIPEVNAIPTQILEKYENVSLIKKFSKIGAAIVVVGVLVFGYSTYANMTHSQKLTEIQNEAGTVSQQIQAVNPFQTFKSNVNSKMTTLSSYLNTDVDTGRIISTMNNLAAANGITLDGVTLSITASDASADGAAPVTGTGDCPTTDPFSSSPSIGCISFNGSQPDDAALKAFFDGLTNSEGISDVFVGNVSYSEGENGEAGSNSFQGSASFTDAFYSLKYGHLAAGIDSILEAGSLTAAEQAFKDAIASGVNPNEPTGEVTETTTPAENEVSTTGQG